MEDSKLRLIAPSTGRRLSALARHLGADHPAISPTTSAAETDPMASQESQNHAISANLTSGLYGSTTVSVFANVVQAPEDPILGVIAIALSLVLVLVPVSDRMASADGLWSVPWMLVAVGFRVVVMLCLWFSAGIVL